ncbi:uncharacterized, partial [Tachysurus ichikawai]
TLCLRGRGSVQTAAAMSLEFGGGLEEDWDEAQSSKLKLRERV